MPSLIITSILLAIISTLAYYGVLPIWTVYASVILFVLLLTAFIIILWALKKAEICRRCDNCPEVYPQKVQMFVMKKCFSIGGVEERLIVGRCCRENLVRNGWRQCATFTV